MRSTLIIALLWIAFLWILPSSAGADCAPLDSLDTPGLASDIAISDSMAYVADSTGLLIVDIRNPLQPQTVGGLDSTGTHIVVSGSIAYVSIHGPGVRVIDISNPSAPHFLLDLFIPGKAAGGLAWADSFLYVAGGEPGLRAFDVRDPTTPEVLDNLDTPGEAYDVTVSGSYAYLADGSKGFVVVDISDPRAGMTAVRYQSLGNSIAIEAHGSRLYVLVPSFGLYIFDLTNPRVPAHMGTWVGLGTPTWASLGRATNVTVSDSLAYITHLRGIAAIDITRPTSPEVAWTASTSDSTNAAVLSGAYLFAAGSHAGMYVFSSRCPPTPVVLSYFQARAEPGSIFLEWATAYEEDFSGFYVLRSFSTEGAYERRSGLLAPPSPYRFRDDEVNPGSTYYYKLSALDRTGASRFFGPIVARASSGAPAALRSSHPNPFVGNQVTLPFALAEAGRARIRILDISGRQVRVVMDDMEAAGEHEALWDGRNDAGLALPAGLYLYELTSPGFHATGRLVKLN